LKERLGETYNIGGNNQPVNIEIIRILCSILDELQPGKDHSSLIRFVADRPGHNRLYDMDIRKIRRELGWQPRQSLQSGHRKTVEWYIAHPKWVS
jgi:dTDP-glucose 4,6-dehydratase